MTTEQFGHYRLDALIGRGGMGEVYRAFDTVTNRMVALKRLHSHLAVDTEFQARFRRESALVARLREPHIIPIHSFGEIDGRLYLDMRLVEGPDLATLIAEHGGLPPARAVHILIQIASAADAAHAEGLVHRDIKPSNVLLATASLNDYAYLVDFGIAHAIAATMLTSGGVTVGTLDYMAPERFVHADADHRVDVYSLTCLLYESLTGHRPFPGHGLPAQMYAHINLPPPRPCDQRPGIPLGLDEVVACGMAKDPDHRYPSAGALAYAAHAVLANTPPTPRTRTDHHTRTQPTTSQAAPTTGPHSGSPRQGNPSTPRPSAKSPVRVAVTLMLAIGIPLAIVVGLAITVWNVVPNLLPDIPGDFGFPGFADGPVVVDAIGPPPWTIEGQGYRYEITSVSRDRATPVTNLGSVEMVPTLTVHGFVTRNGASPMSHMTYVVRNQDDVVLANFEGGVWEDNPTLGQRLPIELRVYDSSPETAALKITINDFYVSNGDLILQGIPIPAG